jgi:tyrosine-protein kinase Etk/Wzc
MERAVATARRSRRKDGAMNVLTSRKNDTVDLFAIVDALWRGRKLIARIVALVFAFGVAYAFLATPVYRADLLVQIDSAVDGASAQLLGPLTDYLGVKSADEAEMQILNSRRVVGAAVERTRYDIVAEPKRFPLLGRLLASDGLAAPGLFGMGGYAWGGESVEVDRFDTPSDLYGERFELVALGDGRYRVSSRHMDREAEGSLGRLLRFPTRQGEAVLLVRDLRARKGTAFVMRRYSRQQTITTLQDRLVVMEKAKDVGVITLTLDSPNPRRAAGLLNAIGDAYVQWNGEQKAEQAAKSLAFLEQQLPGMKRDLQMAEDALLAYRNQHKAVDISESAKLKLGQAVELETRVSQLAQERRAKLEELSPRHPDILMIDSQIDGLRRELQDIDRQLQGLPGAEQDLVRLTREVRVNTELYVAMLNSVQQLRLLKAGKVANVHVVDNAEVAELPVKPQRILVLLGSLLLGLVAGVATTLLRVLWKGAVAEPREIEELLGVPVVASVPARRDPARSGLRRVRAEPPAALPLAATHAHEPVVESLRNLCISLQLALLDARNRVVVITSAMPGMGKSFVSANLAVVLAQSGRRVLLIDGDLRKGGLSRQFRLSGTRGLSQVLRGETTLAKAVRRTAVEGLDILAGGPLVSNPASVLQQERLPSCLAECQGHYDVVLLDTAPVLPVSDTLALARQAGVVYAVALHGISSEAELEEMRARLGRVGVKLDGVILNGVQASLRNAPYAMYGYGYGGAAPAAGEGA